MKLKPAWRLARLVLHLVRGLATCAFVFPWAGAALRERLVRHWSARLLRVCGVRAAPGPAPQVAHGLVVANHVSWLDIFAINAVIPCRFVAKAEIRAWPVLGWLAARAGTVFIARGNRRDLRHIFEGLVAALAARERVALFPEGTTASQGAPLPFHANLFEAALDAGVPVQPLALAYVRADGSFHPAVDYVGEDTIVDSLRRILGAEDPVIVRLVPLAPIATGGGHRRALAAEAQAAIAAALAATCLPAHA